MGSAQRLWQTDQAETFVSSSRLSTPADILTLADVAAILRCSKAHVCNVINGKVPGTPKLTHLAVGRRKLVRREWLEAWMETSKR